MGYLTDFTLEISDLCDYKFEEIDTAICQMNNYFNIGSTKPPYIWEDCHDTWRCHENDMLDLSKKFPEILFVLNGIGEISDDLWKSYYQDGKTYTDFARIIFDKFDSRKLNTI